MILGIVLIVIALGIGLLYFFMTAAKPIQGWIQDYSYAHRGLHTQEYPENSIPAFQNAVEHGFAIELDVHLSKDGVLVVFHDDNLKRMTGVDGTIETYTADELSRMRLGGSNYGMPTLDEVLAVVDGSVPLLIELKNTGRAGALEERLYERMKQYKGKFAVQSFSPFSMRWFYKNAPEILRGQLSATFYYGAEELPPWQRWALRHLVTNVLCRPNFINYEQSGAGRPTVKMLRKKGTPILAWTVRNKAEQQEVKPFADALVFENFEP